MLSGKILRVCFIALIGTTGIARLAHADSVLIGDFENGVDGWGTDGGDASFLGDPPTYAQSTIGATLHTHSLAATQNINSNSSVANPHFDSAASGNLVAQVGLNNLIDATQLSYDETFISSQLFQTLDPSDPNTPSFAQTNELIWSISGMGGSLGTNTINFHGQHNVTNGKATDSANTGGNRGTWSGVDHTSHMSWDLTTFTLTDPTDHIVKTFQQLMAAHPDAIWNSIIQLPLGSGDNTENGVGFGTFFFDNVALVVPEPTSIGLLAVIGLALSRRPCRFNAVQE